MKLHRKSLYRDISVIQITYHLPATTAHGDPFLRVSGQYLISGETLLLHLVYRRKEIAEHARLYSLQ